ncbi:MAG: ABC transporter substrate-binding protein [bacterium]
MKPTFTQVSASALAAVLSVAPIHAETVLRLVPSHTDAFTENYNPNNNSGPANYVQDFAYEPLWIYNVWHPDQNVPALATSFDVALDLLSVTYHLRPGVKWSDGQDFTADDVVFTFDYAKRHPDFAINFDYYDETSQSGNILRAEKVDDLTVRFVLHHPNAMAPDGIGPIMPLPQHIWSKIDNPNDDPANPIVATGPWTEAKDFSRSSFKLCRNPLSRFNADNKIDCLQFPQYSSNEQVIAAISVGDLDWAGDGMTDPELTYTPLSPFNKYWLPADANVNLVLNTTRKPFDNLEFRKAVSMAIDRETLVTISTFNLTTPSQYPIGIGALYDDWIDTTGLEPFKGLMAYDPEGAKAVLDAAGYVDKDGDGFRDSPDGTPISFDISVPAGWTDWINAAQSMSENLQAVGINAELATPEEGSWFDKIPTGDFNAYMMWTDVGATPYTAYESMFQPRNMQPGQITSSAMHQMRIPEIENELRDISSTTDDAAKRKGIYAIEKLVAEDLPVITLFSNPSWYQYSTRNFTGWVDKDNARYRPMLFSGVHERVLHALSLVPVQN